MPMNETETTIDDAVKPPMPRRRRWRRWLFALVVLVLLVLALPYAIAFGPVRERIARIASEALHTECRIDGLSFSWFSGITVRGLEIQNPAGFASERPAVRLRSATAGPKGLTLSNWLAEADGLEVFVEQHADGTTNLQQIGRGSVDVTTSPDTNEPRGSDPGVDPGDDPGVGFSLSLANALLEVRRDGQLLESVTNLNLVVSREPNGDVVNGWANAELAPGKLMFAGEARLSPRSANGTLRASQLDLARFQRLLDLFAPGHVDALAGTLDGDVKFAWQDGGRVDTDGTLTWSNPRLAGPSLRGLDLRGERWVVEPRLALPSIGGAVDPRGFVVDLGWFRMQGKEPLAGGASGEAAFDFDLDVSTLATFGDLVPPQFRDGKTRVRGTLQLPVTNLPADARAWTKAVRADARLTMDHYRQAGFELERIDAAVKVEQGICTIRTPDDAATTLDGGPVALQATIDLNDMDRLPVDGTFAWRNGRLHGGTTAPLRYVVPLLAGVDAANARLTGLCDVEVAFQGPGNLGAAGTVVDWLDLWTGRGNVALRDAAFVPAPQLQGLLAPLGSTIPGLAGLGNDGRLTIDSLATPFTFAQGLIRTTATDWITKGKKIGLSGAVRFDGSLEYALDCTALLRGHKDGDRVLAAIGGTLPPATLAGTVTAPKLALPDVAEAAKRALQGELQKQGQDILQRQLEKLLRRG
jgi:hypothetical protein